MNTSEIFYIDGSNSSYHNSTEVQFGLAKIAIDAIIILLCFPANIYLIWLIMRGAGNGLSAEFFSLNLAICETLFGMESFFGLLSYKFEDFWIAASLLNSLALTGRPEFQCLMCVERYLAVVHPVTFLKYKPLRYRVICCVIAWIISFASSGINIATVFFYLTDLYFILIMVQFSIFLFIQLFCLVAVLRALKQSGPGDRKKEKGGNHMKRKAFYIILITIVTMLIIFVPYMILFAISASVYSETAIYIGFCCFILAGLVQPLLFLYRVRELPFIKSQ